MHAKHPLIDSPHQVISNGRWQATLFLMVEELFPLKYEALKYGQEAPDLRSRSYKLALKEKKLLQTRSYKSAQGQVKKVFGRV
jgi:hypothetical protein